MSTVPLTERANVITEHIDVASPLGMLRLLRQSDAQMFSGFDTFDGLMDEVRDSPASTTRSLLNK